MRLGLDEQRFRFLDAMLWQCCTSQFYELFNYATSKYFVMCRCSVYLTYKSIKSVIWDAAGCKSERRTDTVIKKRKKKRQHSISIWLKANFRAWLLIHCTKTANKQLIFSFRTNVSESALYSNIATVVNPDWLTCTQDKRFPSQNSKRFLAFVLACDMFLPSHFLGFHRSITSVRPSHVPSG